MKRKILKLLSLILAVIMTVQLIPQSVFSAAAQGISDTLEEETIIYENEESENETADEQEKELTVIGEDKSRREANVKHYIMNDGSMMAVSYSQDVHYEENGEWIDIDNTLSEEDAKDSEDYDGYSNTANSFSVKFAKKADKKKLVTISQDKYSLSWGYNAKDSKDKSVKSKLKEKIKLESGSPYEELVEKTGSDTVVYENVDKNISLEYSLIGNSLKENIIVNEKADEYSFSFTIKTKNVYLEMNEESGITVFAEDTKEEVFSIPAPFMYDAEENYSNAVEYSLQQSGNKEYTFTVTADAEWINKEETVFPVKIDPQIRTRQSSKTTTSTYVASASAYANDNRSAYGSFLVGRDLSEYGTTRTLLKINLPTLNKGDMVIDADLKLAEYKTSYACSDTQYVDAHIITESWTASEVTWNTQPSYDSIVYDFNTMTKRASGNTSVIWKYFNITKAVKEWYEGTKNNYGILLKQHTESSATAANARFYSENNGDISSSYYPVILINYRNNKGLEDYWTYTTVGVEDAGTAYINDYTGNLVYSFPLVGISSELGSLGIEFVYNGYAAGTKFVAGKGEDVLTAVGRGCVLNVFQTVRPSSLYGLTGDAAADYPYVYMDGDGTEHYFYKQTKDGTTKYIDEDGLGLTLVPGGTGNWKYYIKDDTNTRYFFNQSGNLYNITNSNDVAVFKATYDSTGTQMQSVQDAAGHVYTFEYSSDNYLTKITDPSSRVTSISYAGIGKVSTITFPNSSKAKYEYDDDGCLIKAIASSGYVVKFTYTSATKGKRVTAVTEYGGIADSPGTALGQKIEFDRTKYNTTKITTSGADGEFGNNDDLITTYQFDNFGRTVSQQLKTRGGTNYGAGLYSYTASKESNGFKSANRVSSSASLGKNVVNQIKGINGEATSNWTEYVSNATISTAASSSYKYVGSKSLAITVNNVTAPGGYGILGQSVDTSLLSLGSTYTFSAYVKCKDITTVHESARTGAYLWMSITNSDGTKSNYYSPVLTSASTLSENGWRRLSVSAVIPDGATKVMAYLVLRNATGTAYFDCMQFELSATANSCNLIENASFERLSSDLPVSWTAASEDYYSSSTSYYYSGSHSVRIQGDTATQKQVYQTVALYGDKDDTYILSGWGRANAVSSKHHENAAFELGVLVGYTASDGTTFNEIKTPAKFNTAVSGWQYTSVAIPIASTKHPDATPRSMTIYCRYAYQANNAYFDNIQLIKDVAQTYKYDNNGNATAISSNSEQKTNLTYHENGVDLKSSTDAAGNKYNYTYDDNHNLLTTTSPRGIVTENVYTANKKLLSYTQLRNSSSSMIIKTNNYYMSDDEETGIKAGAYITKTIDSDGKSTYYNYDKLKGLLKSVENAKGQTTTYSHSPQSDRLSSVSSGGTKVSYGYNSDGRLINIKVADTDTNENYGFVYDKFGNVTSTRVGSCVLITNNYKANNGLLASSEYANGDTVAYGYNNLGLVSVIAQNGYNKYKWSYNSSGVPMQHQDLVNNEKYLYTYDSIGRLIRYQIQSNDTASHIGATEFSYDARNNLSRIYLEFGGKSVAAQYKYSAVDANSNSAAFAKDNLPTQFYISASRHVTYNYNGINQLTRRNISTGRPINYNYTYKSSDRNAEGETTYRTNLLARETIDNTTYNYTYDNIGNITKITKGQRATTDNPDSFGTTTPVGYRSYEYDNLNQLTRENNKTSDKSTEFEYDGIGNITKKTEYTYTTGTLGTATKEITYRYGTDADTGWKNLLTGVDLNGNGTYSTSETIDYDEIGNPTSYLGNTLTWNGRQLKKYVGNGNTITYTYDADGYRATKTVNGGKTTYRYVNGQLVYEEKPDGRQLFYLYDSYGYLTAIRYYNGDTSTLIGYYVTTNAQGDVIGIYNAEGALRATYEYDAWGNIISIKDGGGNTVTSDTHIAKLNSVRYRSYCYDNETGLYYVISRYYNPQVGRWLNADTASLVAATPMDITDKNLFAYCDNNPVVRTDSSGFLWTHILIGTVVGAVAGVVGQIISDAVTSMLNGEITISNWQTYVGATVGGAAGGAVLATTGNMNAANTVTGAVTTGVGQSLEKLTVSNYNKSWAEIGANAVVDGAISYGLGKLPGIKGATAGKNSWSAVYKSGLTKLRNGNATKMSTKVIAKGLGSSVVGGFALDIYYGVKQYAYDKIKSFLQ